MGIARREDYTPTQEQFERGLRDESWLVRSVFAERPDFKPTDELMSLGLNDSSESVRTAFEKKRAAWESSKQVLELTTKFLPIKSPRERKIL